MKGKKERDLENSINKTLKHEENVQHDKNDEPVTYLNEKDIKSLKHKDAVKKDENDEPVTFTEQVKDST